MKRVTTTILLLFILSHAPAQTGNIRSMVDSLPYMKGDTLDCTADLFWRIIAEGEKAIPSLIDKLTDTTETNIRYHCKKTRLNVGEVAHFALLQIASFPAFVVTKIQFDVILLDEAGRPCWNFYDFLFINANKPRYQNNVRDWYAKERPHNKKKKIPKEYLTECHKLFGIDKFWQWTE
jgi:hypothetical protein